MPAMMIPRWAVAACVAVVLVNGFYFVRSCEETQPRCPHGFADPGCVDP
jgi:hypothetical protein